jgi:plastocyanin
MAIGRPINLTGNLAARTISVTATANQTEFTVVGGYRINQIDVFRNGVKLTPQTDFQAADASKVILSAPANLNDEVSFKIFDTFSVADAIVGAASSQIINGDLTVTGTLYGGSGGGGGGSAGAAGTWTNYDNNTGVTTTSKVKIQNDLEVTGVTTSTGGFVGNITGTTGTFSGNVSIGGTLTYEDVTNVDSVGLITARTGIRVLDGGVDIVGGGLSVTGISTFDSNIYSNKNILIPDSPDANSGRLNIGNAGDLRLYHDGTTNFIGSAGLLNLQSYGVTITSWNDLEKLADFNINDSVDLYYDGVKKLETTTSGVTVTGDVTATSFIGNIDTSSSWTLGANGSSDYTFTGPGLTGAENDPTLYLIRGQTYKFVNNMGAHGFRIQSTPNGSTGTQYNDGITNNDVTNGTLTWDVQFDAPDTLYYQCTAHPNMGGIIYIGSESREIPEVSKSTSYTLITSDTGKFVNITSGNITVPSGTFSPGALVTIYNNKSSTMSITASGTTLRKAGTSSTGTCTVAERGTASILCVGSNEFVVAGNIT